jgi:hypothetical protein
MHLLRQPTKRLLQICDLARSLSLTQTLEQNANQRAWSESETGHELSSIQQRRRMDAL